MNRRAFVKTFGATGVAAQVSSAASNPPRQVVFIMTDSVRADMLNCYRRTGLIRDFYRPGDDCVVFCKELA